MTCEELDALVDDLVSGQLSLGEDQRARRHVAECSRCAAELALAEELALRVRQLPRSLSPPNDLWQRISPALRVPGEGGRFRPSWLLLAAASLVAFTLGAGWRWSPRSAPLPSLDASLSGDRIASAAELASVAYSEDHFLHVREGLLAAVEARRDHLPPGTLEVVEENLRLLEEAVGNLRRALAETPDDPDLPLQIATAFRQQARVARQIERSILSL